MKLKKRAQYILVPTALGLMVMAADYRVRRQVQTALEENPEALLEVIKKNPTQFMSAVREASLLSQKEIAEAERAKEQQRILAAIEEPLNPKIREDELFRGHPDAPITIVEYSDFQCPYCKKVSSTLKDLLDRKAGLVRIVYKHVPIDMHDQALITAKYYEAIRLQSGELAHQFHDEIFKSQSSLKRGERHLRGIAKRIGVNLEQLEKDLPTDKVVERIKDDIGEATRFGFTGTPTILVNGVPLYGAQPLAKFEEVIRLLKDKKQEINI